MVRASRYEESRDALLGLIQKSQEAHSKPPSVRDMADELGVGVATVHSYLKRLQEEGLIEWAKGRHRSVKFTPAGSRAQS